MRLKDIFLDHLTSQLMDAATADIDTSTLGQGGAEREHVAREFVDAACDVVLGKVRVVVMPLMYAAAASIIGDFLSHNSNAASAYLYSLLLGIGSQQPYHQAELRSLISRQVCDALRNQASTLTLHRSHPP